MSGKALLVLALLLAALVPTGSASTPATEDPAAAAPSVAANCAGAPPCGYIVPQLALDFPDKPPCKAATLGGQVDLTTCLPLPAMGESVTQAGMLRWYWDMTQDGTYPADPMVPIVIEFTGTATNPKWLELKVEPASFELTAADLASPVYMRPGDDPNAPQVWYWFEAPITVTITRTGDPDAANLEKIGNAGGVQKVFLKAKSNASGAYFKEAFGVEEFRFNAYNDPLIQQGADGAPEQEAPAPGVAMLLGALALAMAAVAIRRRD